MYQPSKQPDLITLISLFRLFRTCSTENRRWSEALQAAEKPAIGQEKDVPQGLKADVFSIVYGPTKVVP